MPATFYEGADWEQSSEPKTIVDVQEVDCWPVAARSESGVKDQLEDGLHPVIAIGEYDAAARMLQTTGVVVSINRTVLGTATDRVEVNIADGAIVRQYVNNALTYSGTHANSWDSTPYMGQPVYVDDSHDLSEGVTLSFARLNEDDEENPLAGHLWYCQDEIADGQVGGSRATATFDTTMLTTKDEQIFCVKLTTAKYLESA